MTKRAMSRKECEDKIWKCLEAIKKIYKGYNPKGSYLSMAIMDENLYANNRHWDEDAKHPLEFCVIDGKKGNIF